MSWELLQLLYYLIAQVDLTISLTIVHGILFVISQVFLRRAKKKLQKEKAALTIQVSQLTGQLNYYRRKNV